MRPTYRSYGAWEDFLGIFGIKSGEQLGDEWRAQNPTPPRAIDDAGNLTGNYPQIPDDGTSGTAEPLFGINNRGGAHKPGDCSGECQSLLDILCYWHKMVNNCGGSTGFCDVVALPGCESWYQYMPIIAVAVVALILYFLLRKKGWRR
jgi:hypothetical protein